MTIIKTWHDKVRKYFEALMSHFVLRGTSGDLEHHKNYLKSPHHLTKNQQNTTTANVEIL